MEQHNLTWIFLFTSGISLVLSLVVLAIFGFEVGVIVSICLATGFVMSGFVGLENIIAIITNKNNGTEGD